MRLYQRTPTKIGDVFKVLVDDESSWFLHFVYIDPVDLNSDVVVAYATHKPDQSIEQIVRKPYAFYLHTTLRFGIKQHIWEKIGSTKVEIDITKLSFKYYRDYDHIDILKDAAQKSKSKKLEPPFDRPYWDVWTIGDTGFRSLDELEDEYEAAEPGGVYPPSFIVERIKTGRTLQI